MGSIRSSGSLVAVGVRSNGRTEYRNVGPLRYMDDDLTIYEVPTGWRSDGVSWPSWLWFAIGATGAAAGGALLIGAPFWLPAALGAWFAIWLAFGATTIIVADRLLLAAFFHDYFCQQTRIFVGRLGKASADGLFYRIMKTVGVPWCIRWPIYRYVRLRGKRVQWQQPEFEPIVEFGKIVGWR